MASVSEIYTEQEGKKSEKSIVAYGKDLALILNALGKHNNLIYILQHHSSYLEKKRCENGSWGDCLGE